MKGGKRRASDEDEGDEASCFPASVTMRQTPHSTAMRNRLREKERTRDQNQRDREEHFELVGTVRACLHIARNWLEAKYVGICSVLHVCMCVCVCVCVCVRVHSAGFKLRPEPG